MSQNLRAASDSLDPAESPVNKDVPASSSARGLASFEPHTVSVIEPGLGASDAPARTGPSATTPELRPGSSSCDRAGSPVNNDVPTPSSARGAASPSIGSTAMTPNSSGSRETPCEQ